MVLDNVIAFVVLKILHNPFSMQNPCLQITAEVSKITKSVRFDLTFIFIEISETVNSFCKNMSSA